MFVFDIKKRNPYCPPTMEGVILHDNGIRFVNYEERLGDNWGTL